jgi:energy-coupling factor transporter ATP-binding protein EcfA2
MRLVSLHVEDFLAIDQFDSRFDGALILLSGKNGKGKTSRLKAIEALIKGAKAIPQKPVRDGAKRAVIVGETEGDLETEALTIKRVIRPSGSTELEVRPKSGGPKLKKPQAILDVMVGPFLDPEEFDRLKPADRLDKLKGLRGLTFEKEDAERDETYNKRTEVNREIKRLKGAIEKLPSIPDDTPTAELSVTKLADELERRRKINQENDTKREKLESLRDTAREQKALVERLEAELAAAREAYKQTQTEGPALRAEVDALEDQDLEEVRGQINNAEQTNQNVRTKASRDQMQAELDDLTGEGEQLTKRIGEIDAAKAEAIASAKYPVKGIEAREDDVWVNGQPWPQASSAERARVSTAIGFALHPKLKAVLIDEGSRFDTDSRKALLESARAAGGQIVMAVVGNTDDVKVIVEDGGA